MTTDQYRRAPIPADGRTIEAMRLALLDTPAGRAMTNAGDTRLYWMNESDAYMLMSPFGIESPFINTPDAVAQMVEAEKDKACRRLISGFMLDCNAIGYIAAAENLVRGIKEYVALAQKGGEA